MKIAAISNSSEQKTFIQFPFELYKNDSNWIPPLISEQKKIFNPAKNPILSHCTYQLFIAYKEEKPVGRIMAFVDHLANEYWKTKIGFFGSYECEENFQASHALLQHARDWLLRQGMDKMRGPINLSSQEWGFVVKGHELPPSIMSPYNPAYYNDQMEEFGLQKTKDLLVYAANGKNYDMPDRFLKYTDQLIKQHRLQVRCLDMKNLQHEVMTLVALSNQALAENWGYVPVTKEEADTLAHDLKLIIDPKAVYIVESDRTPIGFSITFPDLNLVLKKVKGRLFPTGFFRLFWGIKKIRNYRIWALGIIEPFQRKGIDTILYRKTFEYLKPKANLVEANYILEDNFPMIHAIEKLGFNHYKTFRVYETALTGS